MKISSYQIDSYIQKINSEKIAGCLIYGPDLSKVQYYFDIIAKKIVNDLKDPFLVANLSKEKIEEDHGILSDEFFSISMLGGRKLILIKDCDTNTSKSLKMLFENKNFSYENNFVLIKAGNLDKSSSLRKICEDNQIFSTIACYEDNQGDIKKFIISELTKNKIKYNSPKILDIFIDKFGTNRDLIRSEIEKLITYLDLEKNLDIELIEKITESKADISINEFVMSFASNKFEIALIQAEKLILNGEEVIVIIRFLSNYFQKLYFAKIDIELDNKTIEDVKKSQQIFYKIENDFVAHLKNLSLDFIVKTLKLLEILEIKVKSSNSYPSKLLSSFIVSFINLR